MIENLDEPDAEDPRTPECLSMARLEALGFGRAKITPVEEQHVGNCRLCAARLLAFKSRGV